MSFKALVLFGSSTDLLESSFSSTLRLVESFDIDSVKILYSSFAEDQCIKLKELLQKVLKGECITIASEQINESGYETQFDRLIDSNTILSPTSGSKFYAFVSTKIAVEKNTTIIHTMFPFGPWKGMFYPFVPRFFQPVKTINGDIQPQEKVRNIFDNEEAVKRCMGTAFNIFYNRYRVHLLSIQIPDFRYSGVFIKWNFYAVFLFFKLYPVLL